jgi:hypothetical protein
MLDLSLTREQEEFRGRVRALRDKRTLPVAYENFRSSRASSIIYEGTTRIKPMQTRHALGYRNLNGKTETNR